MGLFADFEARITDTFAARMQILAVARKKRGIAGSIVCTVCLDGRVRFTIAKSNGHIHAACTTAGCLQWIE